jgi:hypothetical protein
LLTLTKSAVSTLPDSREQRIVGVDQFMGRVNANRARWKTALDVVGAI